MSQSEEDAADKEHEPSTRRLEEARRKGDIAKSNDLVTAASYSGFLLAASFSVPLLLSAASAARRLLEEAPALPANALSAEAVSGALAPLGPLLATLFGVPALAAITALIAQRGLVFAPERLRPKVSRISPLATAKQKFGSDGLFDFAKSVVKLVIVSLTLWIILKSQIHRIGLAAQLGPGHGFSLLMDLLGLFLVVSVGLLGVIGAIDLLWQRHALLRRNRMSRKELTDETRESEGDPNAKATRRQRGQDLAMNQMLAEVATASVVIVNPTHYAVALRWRRGSASAPVVVAKGVDDIAQRIRTEARKAGVPIHSDPPTARAIHATVRIGQPIDRAHFRAVAAAIRFAEKMRQHARGKPR